MCVCDGAVIDLVCQLEWWREGVAYERVGLDRDCQELAGVALPRLVLPSRPGANMATIVEVAAQMLFRNIRRVPVVKDEKMVGIVLRRDIVSKVIRG